MAVRISSAHYGWPDNRCKNCKYHADEGRIVYGEGVCDNPESNYLEYYTDNNAHCKAFEAKDEE